MNRSRLLALIAAATLLTTAAFAQMGDYGDAPEGALAYPATGVMGAFPTCINVPIAGFVYHAPVGLAYFGPLVDWEFEGNAGLCPLFAPYDQDECFADGDAGLIRPPAYTIVNNQVVPCSGATGVIGSACTLAQWGPNVDILVVNRMSGPAYVNVLMDWDQSGFWANSQQQQCAAPEHVLVNFMVPPGYVGPLSLLMPPPFLIGGNLGHVWSRFTISDGPVPFNWDGAESFNDGESEDYLLLVDSSVASTTEAWGTIKSLYR
jgi:hypothetical protein